MSTRSTFSPSLEQTRSEEHTSELQSRQYLVCRLLLEKKKKKKKKLFKKEKIKKVLVKIIIMCLVIIITLVMINQIGQIHQKHLCSAQWLRCMTTVRTSE